MKKNKIVELADIDFGNDIFNEENEFDLDCVIECLKDAEYISWNNETGVYDNKYPFRTLINNKYLVQFEVEIGECIEATWKDTIWSAECSKIELISINENIME